MSSLDLMFDLAEDRLSPPQTARLEELLQADPARRRQYVDFMLIVSGLHRIRGEGQEAGGLGSGSSRLGLRDFTFPSSDSPGKSPEPPSPDSEPLIAPIIIQTSPDLPSPFFSLSSSLSDWLLSYAAATVIVGAAILGAWAYKLSLGGGMSALPVHVATTNQPSPLPGKPERELVGEITGTADCRWADPQKVPSAVVPMGCKYELASGLVEISYASGAKVILEGPCTYEVDSAAGGFLSLGKLTARVEKNDECGMMNDELKTPGSDIHHSSFITHHLFAVRTPTAVVTDLGTEFGVEVARTGITTSHVFRGSVSVRLAGGGDGQPDVILHENESAHIETGEGGAGPRLVRHGVAANSPRFVRWLVEPPKQLDLLDIVAGGNGTGHHRDRGLDPSTGMEDPLFVTHDRVGDDHYKPVAWHPLIDGVFMPHGGAGAVQLDSAGHVFDRFPKGVASCYGSIWARAAVVRQPQDYPDDPYHWIFWVRQAKSFMPEGRGLLGFSANVGLTFNLEAVRKAYPGSRPVRFRAIAGLADAHPFLEPDNVADFWIFVDGQLKLNRMGLRPKDGTVAVNVALRPGDQFLTLASTDGGDGNGFDWIVFGDPVLEMTSPASEVRRPNGFIRHMPKSLPIKLFSTGLGLKEGDADPHWQIVAVRNDPHFKPQTAVVTAVPISGWLPNNARLSQWLSTANGPPILPKVTYTFRTTFELADMAPGTAVLRGKFIADNYVSAIRLNGRQLPVPENSDLPPFEQFTAFSVAKGFVERDQHAGVRT